jgi:hypothetical protein
LRQRIGAIIWTLKCSDGSGFVRALGAALGDRDGIADQVRQQARLLAVSADPLRQQGQSSGRVLIVPPAGDLITEGRRPPGRDRVLGAWQHDAQPLLGKRPGLSRAKNSFTAADLAFRAR